MTLENAQRMRLEEYRDRLKSRSSSLSQFGAQMSVRLKKIRFVPEGEFALLEGPEEGDHLLYYYNPQRLALLTNEQLDVLFKRLFAKEDVTITRWLENAVEEGQTITMIRMIEILEKHPRQYLRVKSTRTDDIVEASFDPENNRCNWYVGGTKRGRQKTPSRERLLEHFGETREWIVMELLPL
jgi:succinate dehydrogenase flavin-adding protein (antitoxin of CptAB toxin-antitoxin module)